MSIECPFCQADWDEGGFPDHGEGDSVHCDPDELADGGVTPRPGCGKTFWITLVEYDPVYYTGKEPPK